MFSFSSSSASLFVVVDDDDEYEYCTRSTTVKSMNSYDFYDFRHCACAFGLCAIVECLSMSLISFLSGVSRVVSLVSLL